MKGKEESEKAGLKLNIQKPKILVFGLITSWQIDGEIMEIVTDFLFLISFLGLIFSCQSTKITTSFWTTIDRMTLEPTKKDTLHPRTKEKPQQNGRRGTITIKSNPMPARWVIHKLKSNNTFSYCCEGPWPHIRLPTMRFQPREWNPQGIWC